MNSRSQPRRWSLGPRNRKSQGRPARRTVLIVCEGRETERNYLDRSSNPEKKIPHREFVISNPSGLVTNAACVVATLLLLGRSALKFVKVHHMRAAWISCLALLAMFNSTNLCVADDSWWQLLGPTGNGHANAAIHDRGCAPPVMDDNPI
jgi:hypothetical protein